MSAENEDRVVRVSAETSRLLDHSKLLVRLHGLGALPPWVRERVLAVLGERLPTLDAVVHAGLLLLDLQYQSAAELQRDLVRPTDAAGEPQ